MVADATGCDELLSRVWRRRGQPCIMRLVQGVEHDGRVRASRFTLP